MNIGPRFHAGLGAAPLPAVVFLAIAVSSPAEAQTLGRPPAWKIAFSAHGAFESNPLLTTSDQTADESGRLRVALDRAWSSGHGTLTLSGEGSALAYRELSDLNHLAWTVGLRGTYAASRRVALRADGSARSDYTSETTTLTDAGIVLPQVLTRSYVASAGGTWRLSRRVSAMLDGRYDRVLFDSDLYLGGSTLVARPALSIGFGSDDRVILGYEYQRQDRDSGDAGLTRAGGSQGLVASWILSLGHGAQATLAGGVTRLEAGDQTDTSPTGSAGLVVKQGRHGLTASYARTAALAYGFGRSSLTDSASLGDTYAVSPRTSLAARVFTSRYTDPGDTSFELTSWGASATLSRTLSRRFRGTVTYRWARGEAAAGVSRSSHVVALQIGYERLFR